MGITRTEWMDGMDEVEVLIYLIAFLYHYDVATEHEDPANFEEAKWGEARDMALNFCNDRLGEILASKSLREFYKKTI